MLQDILQKLYTIEHIPSHPLVKDRLKILLSDFDLNNKEKTEELIRYISYDSSLTLELLKIANSDSFGLRNKISSIDNALYIMDKDLIELVIAQHPVIPDMELYSTYNNEFLKLVKHSIEVYSLTQLILGEIPEKILSDINTRKELLTAAILHDIGLLFLLIYFPEDYAELIKSTKTSETAKSKIRHGFTADHSMISSVLCENWHLPANIIKWIAFHHSPWTGDEAYRLGAEIIYVADTISDSFYKLYFDDNDMYTIDEHIVMRHNLLDILEKLKINIVKIAEIRTYCDLIIKARFSDMGIFNQ
jgi:HD-like signal output (HDOD) protein